jgi:hypothetical protein
MRELGQFDRAGVERAEQRVARRVQQARVTEVVDVFRGAAEVHQLERRIRGPDRSQLLAYVVLNGLDVVIDALLDRLDGRRRCRLGRGCKLTRALAHRGRELRAGQLRHRRRQVQQPLRLDADALADQSALREQAAQRRARGAVAPIHRRQRIERRQ